MQRPAIANSPGLLNELLRQNHYTREELLKVLGLEKDPSKLGAWEKGQFTPEPFRESRLVYFCMAKQLSDLLLKYEAVLPTYEIYNKLRFENTHMVMRPFEKVLRLRNEPAKIGGKEVDFPIGVPASILTADSERIAHYAQLGYNILTYKTVRSRAQSPHEFPNWLFIPEPPSLSDKDFANPVKGDLFYYPSDPAKAVAANSYGIPSADPREWMADVKRAKKLLTRISGKQVLIVSVFGTAYDDADFDEQVRDFVRVASLAEKAGADIVELNFSCPNLGAGHVGGELYRDPEASAKVSEAVHNAISVPVFVKISYLPEDELTEFVRANEKFIDGIVAINTISMPVVDENGEPIFPPEPIERKKAGISGSIIKPLAQEVVKNLHSLRQEYGYEFNIIGVGGVSTSEDVQDYFDLGADGVQSCTGVMLNENLAIETRLLTGVLPEPEVTILRSDREGVIEMSDKERASMSERPQQDEDRETVEHYLKEHGLREIVPGFYTGEEELDTELTVETIQKLTEGEDPKSDYAISLWEIYEKQTGNKRPETT